MGKYCTIVNRVVTYQFCEDCDDKICRKAKNTTEIDKKIHDNNNKRSINDPKK